MRGSRESKTISPLLTSNFSKTGTVLSATCAQRVCLPLHSPFLVVSQRSALALLGKVLDHRVVLFQPGVPIHDDMLAPPAIPYRHALPVTRTHAPPLLCAVPACCSLTSSPGSTQHHTWTGSSPGNRRHASVHCMSHALVARTLACMHGHRLTAPSPAGPCHHWTRERCKTQPHAGA